MKIVCPKCEKEIGEVTAVARLILTVHCPYDGNDFGVAVEPAATEGAPPVVTGNPTVTAA